MSVSHYRSMATEAAQKARQSRSLADISEFCRQRRSYIALAEQEERVADAPLGSGDDPLPPPPGAATSSPPVEVRWAKIYVEE